MMTQSLQRQSSPQIDTSELKKLFGEPPVLSTENKENYEAIMDRFVESIQPEDFIVLMLIKDLMVSEWEILRLERHKAWAIDRRFRKRLEIQATRKAAHEKGIKEAAHRAENFQNAATGVDHLCELLDVVETTIKDVDRIVDAIPQERDHAEGLEDAFDYYERLDRMLNLAFARRNDCLQQIWRYRADLGEQLRKKCEIIEGNFASIESETGLTEVPLVPLQVGVQS